MRHLIRDVVGGPLDDLDARVVAREQVPLAQTLQVLLDAHGHAGHALRDVVAQDVLSRAHHPDDCLPESYHVDVAVEIVGLVTYRQTVTVQLQCFGNHGLGQHGIDGRVEDVQCVVLQDGIVNLCGDGLHGVGAKTPPVGGAGDQAGAVRGSPHSREHTSAELHDRICTKNERYLKVSAFDGKANISSRYDIRQCNSITHSNCTTAPFSEQKAGCK